MTRIKRGYVVRKRQRFIFTLTSRFRGTHLKLFRIANQQGMEVLASSHQNRNLYENQVLLNRKMLAQMAILDNDYFSTNMK
ncbi:hypothetical protein CY35_11G046500 [Sphagnum magellanicum]|nr:hypothetical protein CY35_11G046500 [Sphagnum magellanicum]